MESSSVSVLINGSPTREFIPTRGLRQGDLVAYFLFLVVVESLAGFVRKSMHLNWLEGVRVGEGQVDVSMLQFTDDTLVVCQATNQNVITIKTILRCFELATDLGVIFHKRRIGAVGVQDQQLSVYMNKLNCITRGVAEFRIVHWFSSYNHALPHILRLTVPPD